MAATYRHSRRLLWESRARPAAITGWSGALTLRRRNRPGRARQPVMEADVELLFVLAAVTAAFFFLAYGLERAGLMDEPPCRCAACARARDVTRGF